LAETAGAAAGEDGACRNDASSAARVAVSTSLVDCCCAGVELRGDAFAGLATATCGIDGVAESGFVGTSLSAATAMGVGCGSIGAITGLVAGSGKADAVRIAGAGPSGAGLTEIVATVAGGVTAGGDAFSGTAVGGGDALASFVTLSAFAKGSDASGASLMSAQLVGFASAALTTSVRSLGDTGVFHGIADAVINAGAELSSDDGAGGRLVVSARMGAMPGLAATGLISACTAGCVVPATASCGSDGAGTGV
jgi:hypothetical protein